MSESARLAIFLSVAASIWVAMHVYVLSRAWSLLPAGTPRRILTGASILLAVAYLLARLLAHSPLAALATPLEWLGANWMGVLFLLVVCLFAADLASAFGSLPRLALPARAAAIATAGLLSATGLVLGHLPPVVRHWELAVPGLPPERDGFTLVAVSDLHLGTLLGPGWTERLVQRIAALRPDAVAVVGDVLDGPESALRPHLPILARLKAPAGTWAVTGNHEFYAGLERSVAALSAAGWRVLRDEWQELVPGVLLAGVDDLTARGQFGTPLRSLEPVLANRPAGVTILLSHTPWLVEEAAERGVAVMISGHTHAGQIWPFGVLVRQRYPFLAGHYQVGRMHLLVGCGTGTWGPRMRLWQRSELLHITLRAATDESR
jgi:predicted MPP superfamily phosphohydrolase